MTPWIETLLSRRGLGTPSGLPLYTYRISEAEFLDLERRLRARLEIHLRTHTLEDVAARDPAFGPLFVIYAAEWWQRRYDGTGWSWAPILHSLGVDDDTWSQGNRSECVTRGLAFWRLKVRESRGLRFLGTIAFNGGLPMQLLAAARGNIGSVLSRVLRLAADSRCDPGDVQRWVESLERHLPLAYRQPQIHLLLADMILAVLRLKESVGLTNVATAIETADRLKPGWRQEFPLPIEDAHARGLLEQLLREAVGVKVHVGAAWIQVARTLARLDDGHWELRSDFVLPDYADVQRIVEAYKLPVESLGQSMTLELRQGSQSSVVGIRRLAGQEKYRLERRPLSAVDSAAAAEHLTLLSGQSGDQWRATAEKGGALSPELVWVFASAGETGAEHRFLRQGGGAIAAHEALVAAPAAWRVEAGGESVCEPCGELSVFDRRLYAIRGAVAFVDPAGYRNRVRCGQAAEDASDYELRGARVWSEFIAPTQAFLGTPRLYERDREGRQTPAAGGALWRPPGGAFKASIDANLFGPVDGVWPNRQEPKWRERVVILPETARLDSVGAASATKGRLVFRDWGLAGCSVETPEVRSQLSNTGHDLTVDLEWTGVGPSPEAVELKLSWPGNPLTARLRLPFPSVGVRGFDADGQPLSNGRRLVAGQLHGIRLVGFPGELHRAYLDLQLEFAGPGRSGRSWQIARPQGSTHIALRLIDYLPEIQGLLADADLVDACVRVKFRVDQGQRLSLLVARYSCAIDPQVAAGLVAIPTEELEGVSPEELAGARVQALRMDLPAEEPIELIPQVSEGTPVGAWAFPGTAPAEGAWLIYPTRESALQFRPVVWPAAAAPETSVVEDSAELPEVKDLRGAIEIPLPRQRKEAFETVIARMGCELSSADWVHAERLAATLGHLPLAALDLWRGFRRSTVGMAAMAFRFGGLQGDFIARFGSELPFLWEIVPYADWCQAIEGAVTQVREMRLPEGLGQQILDAHLAQRIELIAGLAPGVRVLLEAARRSVTRKPARDIETARLPMMDSVFAQRLFDGPDSDVQRLLQFQAEADWPATFAQEVNTARGNPEVAPYLCPQSYGFHDGVINAPVILAVDAVSGTSRHRLRKRSTISAIRAHRAFDPHWFDEAFGFTVARCISTRKISFDA